MLVALIAVALGYVVGVVYTDARDAAPVPAATSELPPPTGEAMAWYRTQGPPPSVVTLPDSPIYPEHPPEAGAEAHRAYEEPLPSEVYVPGHDPETPKLTLPLPAPEAPAPQPDTEAAPPKAAVPEAPPPAWRRYAMATPQADGRPRIAIVLDDLGIDKRRTARAIGLPAPVTMAFLSYATDLESQTAAAREAGHELLVHVPMQPRDGAIDPGPNVLADDLHPDELLRRLRWCLGRFSGYVGINNHMGSRFTGNEAGMAVVMAELKSRGLLFLDSRTSGASVGARMAAAVRVPFAVRNVFLDNENDVAAVRARLAETEAVSMKHGIAIAIGHPRDATLEALPAWLEDVAARGFQLVPISATVTIPEGPGIAAKSG